MKASDDVDVLVVGARCAGAATAMLAAQHGLSVLAVDRAERGTDTLSTHALMRPGVLALSRWGVLDDVRAAGTPTVDEVIYHYGDHVVSLPVKPRGDVDGLYAPRRTVIDPILVRAAEDAGAEVRHGVSFRRAVHDDSGRVVGAVIDGGGGERFVRCSVLVGADGLRSRVADAVAAPVVHRAAATTAVVYGFVGGLPQHVFVNVFRSGRVAGVIPTNDGMANVWVAAAPAELRAVARGELASYFADTFRSTAPDLALDVLDGRPIHGLRSFVGHLGVTRRAHGEGWALVGDAFSMEDPVSAHGMTKALVGADLLGHALGQIASGGDERGALGAYTSQVMRLARPQFGPVDAVAGLDWCESDLPAVHQRANAAQRAEWDVLQSLPVPTPADRRQLVAASQAP